MLAADLERRNGSRDQPDLVEGQLLAGAMAAAFVGARGGLPAWSLVPGMILAGALAGLVTALLNVRFGILHLLASILTMIALFSINLRIMGRPNIALIGEPTILSPFEGLGLSGLVLRPLAVGVISSR